MVTLGNNHLNDWLAAGVASTVDHLRKAGYAAPGGGSNSSEARAGSMLDVDGRNVAFLSYTTVNGDFVNDNLPVAGDRPPVDLAAGEFPQTAVAFAEISLGNQYPAAPIKEQAHHYPGHAPHPSCLPLKRVPARFC